MRILYDAFPYERFGAATGVVSNISSTILTPQDGPGALGIQEPVYKVIVTLDKQSVFAYGKEFNLQEGMSLKESTLPPEKEQRLQIECELFLCYEKAVDVTMIHALNDKFGIAPNYNNHCAICYGHVEFGVLKNKSNIYTLIFYLIRITLLNIILGH